MVDGLVGMVDGLAGMADGLAGREDDPDPVGRADDLDLDGKEGALAGTEDGLAGKVDDFAASIQLAAVGQGCSLPRGRIEHGGAS